MWSEPAASAVRGLRLSLALVCCLWACGNPKPCKVNMDCTNGYCGDAGTCVIVPPDTLYNCDYDCFTGEPRSTTYATGVGSYLICAASSTDATAICTTLAGTATIPAKIPKLASNCGPQLACQLAPNPCANPWQTFFTGVTPFNGTNNCFTETPISDPAIVAGTFAYMEPIPPSDHANVTWNTNTTAVTPSGQVAFRIEPPAQGSAFGSFLLNYLETSVQEFHVGGHDVAGGLFVNDAISKGPLQPAPQYSPTAMSFGIPNFSFNLVGTGTIDGTYTGLTTTLPNTLSGLIDLPNRLVRLAGVFTSADGTVSLDLDVSYHIDNLPPKADASATATTFPCTGDLQGTVHLDGTRSSDPDGLSDIVQYAWVESTGSTTVSALATGATADVSLTLGVHLIELIVTDSAGQNDATGFTVTVTNSTPPVISVLSASPSCLWPPNHEMVLYRLGREIQVAAQSGCDPSVEIAISGIADSQPFAGGGQGNTTPDYVNGSAAACLRAERQGTSKAPRVYTLSITASDHQGNSTTETVAVTVPHDQGQGKCANVDPSLIVANGDPRCLANLTTPTALSLQEPPIETISRSGVKSRSGGCNSAAGPTGSLLVMLSLFPWRRRPAMPRRKGRQ